MISKRRFPMGATRVINLASFPIRLNLAGARHAAHQTGRRPGLSAGQEGRRMEHVHRPRRLRSRTDQWVPVATQSWKSSIRKRDWVITQLDPATRQPAIRLYQDHSAVARGPTGPVSGGKAR